VSWAWGDGAVLQVGVESASRLSVTRFQLCFLAVCLHVLCSTVTHCAVLWQHLLLPHFQVLDEFECRLGSKCAVLSPNFMRHNAGKVKVYTDALAPAHPSLSCAALTPLRCWLSSRAA
jgi:hypothetical protein